MSDLARPSNWVMSGESMVAVVRRCAVVLALALASVLVIVPSASATRDDIRVAMIGRPVWKPVDCHLFSAPIGTAATGYAEYLETLGSILPPPHHVPIDGLGIGPGAPHRPPYKAEVDRGIADQGYREARRFRPREFSNGFGVFLVGLVVPRPGMTGSSPDFRFGPITPNRLFPITVEGAAFRNRQDFDQNLDFQVPPLTTKIDPDFDVDG
ncbi:MAG: hypothetical protein ABWX96_11480, partial [Propionibacteriaceae bacterium]